MLKKAMIMAAGVGSRLEDLSEVLPKPLAPLVNKAAMDIIIEHLSSFGINQIIANTYYKSEYIEKHYRNNKNVILNREKELSGTAGGVKKCQYFFSQDENFIVMSADGLCDVDISEVYKSHIQSGAIATIVLKEVEEQKIPIYGIVVPDKHHFVESFQEKPKTEEAKSNLANTGIYIFNYKIFNYIPQNTFYDFAKNVFPNLMKEGEKINTYIHKGYWSDIGSISQYKESHNDLLNKLVKNYQPEVIKTEYGQYSAGENFALKDGVEIIGNCSFGKNCAIGKNAKIKNSILWDNIKVEDGVVIENSIVLSRVTIRFDLKDTIKTVDETEVLV